MIIVASGKQRQRFLIDGRHHIAAKAALWHFDSFLRLVCTILMDDDLTFGASVWGQSDPVESTSAFKIPLPVSQSHTHEDETAFDDFDDFGVPEEGTQDDIKDDDFGDFGDFGEPDAGSSMGFGDSINFDEDVRIAGPSSQNWRPLLLDPFPSRQSLEQELDDTLGTIWQRENIADITTDEPIREAEGIAQILVTPSRCVC